MRAVIDTNVLVSGLLRPRGAPGAVVRALRDRRFVAVVSPAILEEIIDVLSRPWLRDKYAIDAELTFGRGDSAKVKIDDTLVSRMHARIFRRENGAYVIEDLDSRNGTQVNGMAVVRQVLTYGDRIQIGSCLLLFAPITIGWSAPRASTG